MDTPLLNTLKSAFICASFLLLYFSSFGQYENLRLDSTYNYNYSSLTDSTPSTKTVCSFRSFPNTPECNNFSTCISSNWDGQTRIWTPYAKGETRVEGNGSKTARFSHFWNAKKNEWEPQERSFDLEQDNKKERDLFRWDTTLQDWTQVYAIKTHYDENGNTILFENKNYQVEDKIWTGFREVQTYDEANRRTSYSHFEWNSEQEEWQGGYRYTQTYNSMGNLQEQVNYSWFNDPGEWNRQSVENFTYNSQGKEIYWEKTNLNDFGSGPIIEEKRERSYDAMGNEIEYIYSQLNFSNFEWQVFDHLKQTYNNQNQLLSKEYSYWDYQIEQLYLRERNTFTYAANGKIDVEERWGFDVDEQITYGSQIQYAYDEKDRIIVNIRSTWDRENEIWVLTRKNENPYTSFDRRAFFAWYEWDIDLEKWIGKSKTGFDYAPQEYLTRRTKAFWRPQQNDWYVSSSTVFAYGPCKKENLLPARESSLLVYPNPATASSLRIESELERPFAYEVLDLQGKRLLQGEMNAVVNMLRVSSLTAGTYILQCRSGNSVEKQKFSIVRN